EIGLVSTTMPRLSPPLAKFEGFALVGRDGWVKVHSQPSRSLRESLTLESNGDPALAAALWYRAPGRFDVLYHGRDHRMRVDPVEGSDSRLVSFLDMRGIRAAAAEQFAGAAGLFAIYALLFVLVALLVQIADPRYCAEWLWPDRQPSRVDGYLRAAACLLITAGGVPHAGGGAPPRRAPPPPRRAPAPRGPRLLPLPGP